MLKLKFTIQWLKRKRNNFLTIWVQLCNNSIIIVQYWIHEKSFMYPTPTYFTLCVSNFEFSVCNKKRFQKNRYKPRTRTVAVNRLSPKSLKALTVYFPPSEFSTLSMTREYLPPSAETTLTLPLDTITAPSFDLISDTSNTLLNRNYYLSLHIETEQLH